MSNDKSINEIWNKFEQEFDIDEEIDFFALSSILRVIIEKENLKKTIDVVHWSIIHKFLHWESIRSDKSMYLISIINILEKLPEKYSCEKIKEQILKNIPKELDFFKILSIGSDVNKKYRLKITNFSFFSYSDKIFFYTGKTMDKKNDKQITFVSRKKFTIGDVYDFYFRYVTINYHSKIFDEIKSENISIKIKERVLSDNFVPNYDGLLLLLKTKNWPLEKEYILQRKILKDIYYYKTSNLIENEKFLPFLNNPHIAKMFFKKNDIYEIINSYSIDEKTKNQWEIEKKWKNDMEINNSHYLEVDESLYTNYLPNWSSDFAKEKFDKKFLIYHKNWKKEYSIFEKLFANASLNSEKMRKSNNIFTEDLERWNWKCDENGKTSKIIFDKIFGNGAMILLGPAGHGKTFSLNEVIDIYLFKKLNVKLICPTWKAISLYEDKVASSTVSARIEHPDDGFFDDVNLLIIDEISLIGDWSFLSGVKSTTQIIFSGDINQLRPLNYDSKMKKEEWLIKIATSKKLYDLKEKKNHRISKLDKKHDGPIILENLIKEKFNFRENAKHINCLYSIKEIIEKLKQLTKDNYTVITEFDGGMWGVDFLNRILKRNNSENFEIGDRIIFIDTKRAFNNIDVNSKPVYWVGLFGEIIDIKNNNNISKCYSIKTNASKVVKVNLNDEDVSSTIQHAYAINAYKAQGATIENVVVLSPSKVRYDWLYTAVSRFSKNIEIIFITGGSEYIEFIERG